MHHEFSIPLRGGGEAQVRPVLPTDKMALETGFSLLSEDSKYHRFLAPIKSLNSRQLTYFTEVDQVNHVAWGVGIPKDGELLGIAIGRYVRLPDEPTVAEFALTVIDNFQGQGLGTFLMALLYRLAQRQGDIQTLRGVIGNDNHRMLKWMAQLEAHIYSTADGTTHADLNIVPDIPNLPDNKAAYRFGRILELIKEGEAQYEAESHNSSEPT
ncbi:MAG: GNAT family N-acetyltransferase [Chloroflexota bacterium]